MNLTNIINSTLDELKYTDKKQLHFSISVDDKIPMYSDGDRLRVVMNNLVSNAIKYSDESKDNQFVQISMDILESEVKIIVRDNGIGIENEYLPKIFNMFYRATNKAAGSGLGLYITREIVETLGGTIEVSSLTGEGTVFTLRIPNCRDMELAA